MISLGKNYKYFCKVNEIIFACQDHPEAEMRGMIFRGSKEFQLKKPLLSGTYLSVGRNKLMSE